MLDAGCAFGFLVEALRKRSVDAHGLDVSPYAIDHVDPAIAPYCRVGSVTEPIDGRYDLVVSIEVLEHLSAADAERAIDRLCACTDDVLFSSTPNDYREASHFNVRPPAYWAEAFARRGLLRDVDFDATFVTPWAARFTKSGATTPRVVGAYERRLWELTQEVDARRTLDLEHREELARLSEAAEGAQEAGLRAAAAEAELADERSRWEALGATPGGRVLTALQRGRALLAPPGTLRERFLVRIVRGDARIARP